MLGYLLKQKNIEAELISGDYFLNETEFLDYLSKQANNYSVIGLTSTTPQFEQVKKINDIMKKSNPKLKSILGGPHTLYYKTEKVEEDIDVIHIGHGIDVSANIIEKMLKEENINSKIVKTDYYYDCPKDFELIPKKYINDTMLYSYLSFFNSKTLNISFVYSDTSLNK